MTLLVIVERSCPLHQQRCHPFTPKDNGSIVISLDDKDAVFSFLLDKVKSHLKGAEFSLHIVHFGGFLSVSTLGMLDATGNIGPILALYNYLGLGENDPLSLVAISPEFCGFGQYQSPGGSESCSFPNAVISLVDETKVFLGSILSADAADQMQSTIKNTELITQLLIKWDSLPSSIMNERCKQVKTYFINRLQSLP